MNKHIYYAVEVITDAEGYHSKSIANFTKETSAYEFSKSKFGCDMYGRPGTVKKYELIIYDSYIEGVNDQCDKIVERALNKLTKEEREALGL